MWAGHTVCSAGGFIVLWAWQGIFCLLLNLFIRLCDHFAWIPANQQLVDESQAIWLQFQMKRLVVLS